MALIECLDCGRKVSDAAVVCPACARPVSLSAGAPRDKPRHSVSNPLPPRALSAFQQVVKESRVPAPDNVQRICVVCGDEVSRDAFRLKRGDGYICMDCQDDEADDLRQRAARLRTLRMTAMVLLLLVGLTTFVVHMVATNPPPAPKANKR
jgi:hypothetical protein